MSGDVDTLYFGGDGVLRAVYSDSLPELLADLGEVRTRRASHVEPAPAGGWTADLAPAGGPRLGAFQLRGEALEAETSWLRVALERGTL